jgi:hypothetical protein
MKTQEYDKLKRELEKEIELKQNKEERMEFL